MIGSTISHYEILERLGGGGMGDVYKARDTELNRFVALKFLSPQLSRDDTANKRFVLEAQSASSLNHANICTIHQIGSTDDGRFFIAMGFYEGETLKHKISAGPTAVEDALSIVAQVADGLSVAHERDIVHRDIKPANIMVTRRGRAVILDFGIAKLMDRTSLTQTGATLGTVAYMSPEQARADDVDERTDVWSLGIVLFEMLMGDIPFSAHFDQAVIYNILNMEPERMDELRATYGDGVADLVRDCLSKDAAGRPESHQVAARARALIKGMVTEIPHAIPAKTSSGRFAIPAAIIVIVAALFGWMWLSGSSSSQTEAAATEIADTVVIIAEPSADPGFQERVDGFTAVLNDEVVRLARAGAVPVAVAPTSDFLEYDVKDPDDARRIFGADSVLSVRLAEVDGSYRVRLRLTTMDGSTVFDSTAFLVTNLRYAHGRSVGEASRLLGGDADARSSISTAVDPAAFDAYVAVEALLQNGDSLSILRAIDWITPFSTSPGFPQAKASLIDGLTKRFAMDADTVAFRQTLENLDLTDTSAAGVLAQAGVAYAALGEQDRAIDLLARAARSDSLNGEAITVLADLYRSTARFDEADSMYSTLIALEPSYWRGYMRYGVFLYYQGRYAEAAEAFRAVVERSPDYARGYSSLGAALFGAGDLDGAERVFNSFPGSDHVLFSNAGTLYFYRGEYRKAVRWYEAALALDPSDPTVWTNLSTAYFWLPNEEQNYQTSLREAMRRTQEQFDKEPNSMSLRASMANFHAAVKDTAKAVELLEEIGPLPAETMDGSTVFRVAAAWDELGDRDKALLWLDEALKRDYSMTEIERSPDLEGLRADPRYKELIRRHRSNE